MEWCWNVRILVFFFEVDFAPYCGCAIVGVPPGTRTHTHIHTHIYIYIYIANVVNYDKIFLEPNTPECIGACSHETYVGTPLVGHTCTDRLLIDMELYNTINIPCTPLPSATTLVLRGEARAQVGYDPKTSKAITVVVGCVISNICAIGSFP